MILKVAVRSLLARPARSAVLAVGFGLGVGVMAALLGVGGVILDQARAPALIGGGDVLIGSSTGRVNNAPFVLAGLRPGGPYGSAVAAAAPSERATLYLLHGGRSVAIRARGGIPSAERGLADTETSAVPSWVDTPADRASIAPDPDRVLRTIDRFHAIPDVPARAASWAEWLYFNGRAGSARFYLTFLAGPTVTPGHRTLGVRLQLERAGHLVAYAGGSIVADGDLLAAPDLTSGANTVRLIGRDYHITLDLPAESGRGRAAGTIVVHAPPDRSMPPFLLQGAGGWVSGYVVPVMSGTLEGMLRAEGETIDLSGGAAYHDHNWGFWEGVSWQWGQVEGAGLSFVYGRVYPPADAADPQRLPGFLVALGPSGPLGFATSVAITETNVPGTDRPHHIVVRSTADALSVTLDLSVEQTTVTHMRPAGLGGGLDFLQMRARYHVTGHAGARVLDFTAPGSAETFVGRRVQ